VGETGRVDAAMIFRHVANLQTPIWYLAGPVPMVSAMPALLASLGVAKDDVRFEAIYGY
jgi:ferredoxin-NADP reductase